jgi:hypothetical protein
VSSSAWFANMVRQVAHGTSSSTWFVK